MIFNFILLFAVFYGAIRGVMHLFEKSTSSPSVL